MGRMPSRDDDPAPSTAESVENLTRIARSAFPDFGIPGEAALVLVSVSENATFGVLHPDGRQTALRVHRVGYHSEAAIDSELAWIEAVRAAHIVRTPAVLPTRSGARFATVASPDAPSSGTAGRRQVAHFQWVDGYEPRAEDLLEVFARLGSIAAHLHGHARFWVRPPGFTRLRWDVATAVGRAGHWGWWGDGLGVGAAETALFSRLVEELGRRLGRYGDGPDRFGLVHADMRLANLLLERGAHAPAELSVIDFDDCGFSWFLYDLAASLSFIEHEPVVPDLCAAWVDGYRAVATLSSEDLAVVPTLILLRRLLLVAWIGSHAHTDLARSMGEQFTRDSCDLAEAYLSGRFLAGSTSLT